MEEVLKYMRCDWEVLISFLCIGFIKGWKDLSSEDRFIHPYLNKTTGSEFKYKKDESGRKIPILKSQWKYLWIFTPSYQERFYLSSLQLVAFTDWWHLLDRIFIYIVITIQFTRECLYVWYSPIFYISFYNIGFNLVYNRYYKHYLSIRKRSNLELKVRDLHKR